MWHFDISSNPFLFSCDFTYIESCSDVKDPGGLGTWEDLLKRAAVVKFILACITKAQGHVLKIFYAGCYPI